MPIRDEVRRTQQTLAALDADHRRATRKLDQARAHRAEVLVSADRAVTAAAEDVDAAVAAMACSVGVDLTAQMLAVEVTEVRRIVKAARRSPAGGTPTASS